MSNRSIVHLLRTAVVIGVLLALIGSTLWIAMGFAREWNAEYGGFNALFSLVLAILAWYVVPHQPRNPVVWIMAGGSFFAGEYVLLWAIAAILSSDPASVVVGNVIPAEIGVMPSLLLMVAEPGWMLATLPFLTFGLLLFPDGRLPSPGWRWIGVPAVAGITLAVAATVWALRPSNTQIAHEGVDFGAQGLGFLLAMIAAALCLAGLVVRFRRSRGVMRQQLKWIVWGGTMMVVALIIAVPVQNTRYEDLALAPSYLAVVCFVGSYGIAVGRHRLYDIDLVISRTLVFAALAGFITVVYAVIVVGAGTLIGGGDGLALPIAATAVVAIAFEPARQVAQGWANRLVYGQRVTPYEVLSDLTSRLANSEEGERILARMASLLAAGTGADRATVWLGVERAMEPGATWPPETGIEAEPNLDAENTFPVVDDGELVGALEVVKPRGSALSTAERSLVSDMAGSAGLVLAYQRLNDSLQRRADELQESRRRLMDAQDEERRRLERHLYEGAQQLIVSLRVKIALARKLAARCGAHDVAQLLSALEEETDAALDEVRSLAKGIYPPVLESDGLTAAVSGLIAGFPVDAVVDANSIGRYPPEVEAAFYFDISEAVTNATKHGLAPIRIDLTESDGMLRFAVTDSGPGFDPASANGGTGLANMEDRLDAIGGRLRIDSEPGGQTTVAGEIPLLHAFT